MKIQVIIPHYNGFPMLSRCLDALLEQTFRDFQIIVADNNSADHSAELIKEHYPEVILIENKENLGFAGAVNQGIRLATAPYVLLLNNDTVVFPDFLEKMLEHIEKDEKIFAVSSHMLKVYKDCPTDGSAPLEELYNDSCGDIYTLPGWAFCRGAGKPAKDYMKDATVFSACAGAALYRKKVFDEIGLFDNSFFAYREDIDVCYRAEINGYHSIYASDAFVYHLGSATTGGKYSHFKIFHGTRNTVWLHYKNMPLVIHLINLPFLLTGHIIKFLYFIKKGYGKDYLKGFLAGIGGIFTRKVKKHPFRLKNIPNYIKIEAALIANSFKVL